MTNEVDATGFGRCSVVNYTKDARPFLDHMSVVPILNHTYSIPRLTHLCWTHDAVFMEKNRGLERTIGRKRSRDVFLGDGGSTEEEEEKEEMEDEATDGGTRMLLILPGSKRRAALLEGRAAGEDVVEGGSMSTSPPPPASTTITPTSTSTRWECWQPPKDERIKCCGPPRLQVWVHSSPPTPIHTATSSTSTPPTPTMTSRLVPA